MSAPRAHKRPSTVDKHRYDSPYVGIAVAVPGDRTDDVAPPLVFQLQPRNQGRRR